MHLVMVVLVQRSIALQQHRCNGYYAGGGGGGGGTSCTSGCVGGRWRWRGAQMEVDTQQVLQILVGRRWRRSAGGAYTRCIWRFGYCILDNSCNGNNNGTLCKVRDGIVDKVIVAEADFFDTFIDDSAGEWIQTCYNTIAGFTH